MKPKSSCELCRTRHRRCITRPGATRCNGCEEVGEDCRISPKFQFRPGRDSTDRRGKTCVGELSTDFQPREEGNETLRPRPRELRAASTKCRGRSRRTTPHGNVNSPRSGANTTARSQRNEFPGLAAFEQPSDTNDNDQIGGTAGFTLREAFLFRLWVQKLSLSSDGVDDSRRFGFEVSRLALQHRMILYAILALASRFDGMATGCDNDLESTYYQTRCTELLIQSLSRPPEQYDTKLLIAVLVSSLYEETQRYTESMTYHLNGARTLLSSGVISRLAKQGGLAEAACWVHLRQTIYVAIAKRRQLDVPLSVYEGLPAFEKDDDSSYANRSVFIFAQALNALFDNAPTESNLESTTWRSLSESSQLWYEQKPSSFKPLFHDDANAGCGQPFPRIWMMTMTQAVGLQYYYATMILLNLHGVNNVANSGFEAAKERKHFESKMSYYLCAMIGLALSNPEALNIWFMPCHMLAFCGYCISHPEERIQAVDYLGKATQAVHWKTDETAQMLKRQWYELDGFEL